MLDSRFIAFEAVVREGSFEQAARSLSLTQSAVSQRIRQLESDLGQVLLMRTKPVRPTPAGRRLLPYLSQMRLLQTEADRALQSGGGSGAMRLSVGVNADSFATWFWPAVAPVVAQEGVVLDCVLDDQDHTHALLASGEVLGCVSTRREPMRGCVALRLGVMRYRCIGSEAFRRRHFPRGLSRSALGRAPAIVFGRHDDMHEAFLLHHFGLDKGQFPYHVVPSSEGFVAVASAGLGYGFIPELQVATQLADGGLIDLAPDKHEDVTLFWHHWEVQSPVMTKLCGAIVEGAGKVLPR
ncbi:LysR family transcriptional regulator ArgP [Azoarcus taiwanensis]|uniref:ArgP/LysG family DNA-binding transcriptional regulator n=1 Tax=Azoarcus taiwanensis TaxID=666964 RepID=A0A972J8F3_9RHOO|nr:LysR family transcriptional regulator ArgP [Azoarcus taiwanensis]NMG01585.1 ArgP/LysG family DNA-binding transcriptional regulator [Azoarcus taiwanensis]